MCNTREIQRQPHVSKANHPTPQMLSQFPPLTAPSCVLRYHVLTCRPVIPAPRTPLKTEPRQCVSHFTNHRPPPNSPARIATPCTFKCFHHSVLDTVRSSPRSKPLHWPGPSLTADMGSMRDRFQSRCPSCGWPPICTNAIDVSVTVYAMLGPLRRK